MGRSKWPQKGELGLSCLKCACPKASLVGLNFFLLRKGKFWDKTQPAAFWRRSISGFGIFLFSPICNMRKLVSRQQRNTDDLAMSRILIFYGSLSLRNKTQVCTLCVFSSYLRQRSNVFAIVHSLATEPSLLGSIPISMKNPLTFSPPIPFKLYTLPYWSNQPVIIFDIRALWRSGLSARAPECQKSKLVDYTSMAPNASNSNNLEQLALKGLNCGT